MSASIERISQLKIWKSDVDIKPVEGGITNQNYVVSDSGQPYFVRVGVDIPEHGIMRFNELAASQAAYQVGISPAVIHAEPGIMVLQYIDAQPLTSEQVRNPNKLPQIIDLIKRCHQDIPSALHGPALVFWVFQVLRDYSQTLHKGKSSWASKLAELNRIAVQLEQDVGEIKLAFGHNDLLPANFVDDGSRLWLIDWDYAGFNSPLFDLGGLASNNEFSQDDESFLLESYFGSMPKPTQLKKYAAMKCASLLREVMWSMVSEIYSSIDFDYAQYTKDNLALFQSAWDTYQHKY